MFTSKRARTLSEEGLKLYGMMGSHPTKKGIRRLLFACFWSDYDQRLKDVAERMRESTKSLYKQMDDKGFDKRMDAGIQHLIFFKLHQTFFHIKTYEKIQWSLGDIGQNGSNYQF